MLALTDRLAPWLGPGQPHFAVATVVGASGSVPRPVGTAMAVRADGAVIGSLSGGCVEAAVHAAALDAIAVGECHRETFGYSDDDAFAVGLTCGGSLEVHVQPVRPGDPDDPGAVALERLAGGGDVPAALVRRLDVARPTAVVLGPEQSAAPGAASPGPDSPLRALVDDGALPAVSAQVAAVLRAGGAATVHAAPGVADGSCAEGGPEEPVALLVETRLAPPRFVVVGANDFAGALVRAVRLLGYHVTLVDAREVFAAPRRFPQADEVVVDWPDRYLAAEAAAGRLDGRTAVAVLTHDAKFDVPTLRLALGLPLAYVGAMGSRRSHAQRLRALRDQGVTPEALARLRSPIGLDLGAVTPEEVAVSVVAELVAVRHGRTTAVPLSATDGPLHAAPGPPGASDIDIHSGTRSKERPRWT
ncbi:XdhC family protein [Krasilnikoviella flava]|uniref:Xanthine dehydrogenase accessory factor n=1 Tax=Krasilnikoviella flava TaxID=526729 RepID=A0A1T5JJH7_9MICO|nr:XdhC/CoxI family protein [Krasilnikoviella flava]SKC51506.1 xanthine dehydrogenase accessory factor [Krasilnikoviella flava]